MDRYVSNPFTLVALALFGLLAFLVLPLVFLGIIGGAFANLGFSFTTAFLILFATLAGSFVNLPLATVRNRVPAYEEEFIPFVNILYRIPLPAEETTLAINVGGGLIPILISLYLLAVASSPLVIALALLGVAAVSVVARLTSRVVPGLGIATPLFIPPLSALLCGLVLSVPAGGGMAAPVIAYTSGTLGVLVGADLLNLGRIRDLGAPMVSIGGAGTFDGIFLAGVIAAFLA